jgi:ribosomal protein S18 acetylase RimI-like enzyme
MSDFTIRPVRPEDYTQWLVLWEAYNSFYGRSGATALPEAVNRTTWTRFLDPAEPLQGLVAIRDGEVAGLAHCLYHYSTSAIDQTCYLQDIYTAVAYRGQGIARALIAAIGEAAKQQGTTRLYWHTHDSNRTAQKLYDQVAQKSGFIVYRKML